MRRLVADAARDALSLDAKLWRSLRHLVVSPGRLTADYMAGRRASVLGPFQLFVVANLIYFIVQPYTGFNGYNTPLASHAERQAYSAPAGVAARVEAEIARRVEERVARTLAAEPAADPVRARAEAEAVERAIYPTRFDAKGEVYARSLVLLVVPALALALAVLYSGRPVPMVQHLVFALHLQAWQLIFVASLLLPVLAAAARPVVATPATVFLLEYGSLAAVAVYIFAGLRRAYGDGRRAAAARAAAMVVVTFYATVAYRFVLFLVTFATT